VRARGVAHPGEKPLAGQGDDLDSRIRFHPEESSGLVVEAARRDDFERAGMLGPHRPKQQRTILRRQSRDKVASKSLDALERPGVVVALRAALLALAAVDLELPRKVGTDDAERLSSSEKHFQLVDGAALLDPSRIELALGALPDLAMDRVKAMARPLPRGGDLRLEGFRVEPGEGLPPA